MATRKRNEWLDDEESESDDGGYNSELAEQSKGRTMARRSTKRRRTEHERKGNVAVEKDTQQLSKTVQGYHGPFQDSTTEAERQDQVAEASDGDVHNGDTRLADTTDEREPKSSVAKNLARSTNAAKKSGVIYLSRVPPFMKPHIVKHFLSPYAPSGLGRIFLSPESQDVRQSRLRAGGNRKRKFTDGWIEFTSKKEAKIAVETLNAHSIGGKKGGYYRDDVWNLKYLRGFKWIHLTEQIANENAERAARLRAEDAKERREVREYLRNVEFAKMKEGMEKKMEKKVAKGASEDLHVATVNKSNSDLAVDKREQERRRLHFRQTEVKLQANDIAANAPRFVEDTLSRIF